MIIIIIIIIIIYHMYDIYNYAPETNHVSVLYNVIAHKLHTNQMHYIFTFYPLTPTHVSAFTRPSSGGS
jgi:hypothetical protein